MPSGLKETKGGQYQAKNNGYQYHNQYRNHNPEKSVQDFYADGQFVFHFHVMNL